MKDNMLKKINTRQDGGYILVFTLVIVFIIMFLSLSIARIVEREVLFSRMAAYNREAYFAADSGLECAQYIDGVLRDDSKGVSLFLNSVINTPKIDFLDNARDNVFYASTSIPSTLMTYINFTQQIFCSSDGTYNRIFYGFEDGGLDAGYVSDRAQVLANLALATPKSSYTIVGNEDEATTTFAFVLKDQYLKGDTVNRCVVVDFYKQKSSLGLTSKYVITSTGYSSCRINNPNTVSRTIQQFSSN